MIGEMMGKRRSIVADNLAAMIWAARRVQLAKTSRCTGGPLGFLRLPWPSALS